MSISTRSAPPSPTGQRPRTTPASRTASAPARRSTTPLLAQPDTADLTPTLRHAAEAARAAGPEAGVWVAPIERASAGNGPAIIALDDYLTLVDETGRIVRSEKRGSIPADLAPILDRLDLDLDAWLDLMRAAGSFLSSAVGRAAARAREAIRRGARWIVDSTRGLHREPEPTA